MIQTITPIDNTIYVEREYNSKIIEETISNSVIAQNEWGSLKVEERVDLLKKFVADFLSKEKQIIEEITRQMGRPISQALNELKGFKERADYMLSIAEDKLKNIYLPEKENFKNYMYLPEMPNPDILIRTAGEKRLSNFLLYQLSYTELMFIDTL